MVYLLLTAVFCKGLFFFFEKMLEMPLVPNPIMFLNLKNSIWRQLETFM